MKKGGTKKLIPGTKITMKQKIFTDEYIKTGNRTKSAMKAYNLKNYKSAAAIGSQNLNKINIIQYLKDNSDVASSFMVSVINNPLDKTSDRITAAKDVLDRAGYKPIEKIQEVNLSINVENMESDELIALLKK